MRKRIAYWIRNYIIFCTKYVEGHFKIKYDFQRHFLKQVLFLRNTSSKLIPIFEILWLKITWNSFRKFSNTEFLKFIFLPEAVMTTASAASLKINLTWFTLTYALKKAKEKKNEN